MSYRCSAIILDSDPDWFRIQSGQWIRIQEGKNDPQKIGKFFEMSCFEVLEVLFSGLKASSVAWTSLKGMRYSRAGFLHKSDLYG
jgi:hypothetical protein